MRKADGDSDERRWGIWPPPHGRPRHIDDGALVHCTVLERRDAGIGYAPENLPSEVTVES